MIKEKKIPTFVVFLCFIMTILGLSSCRNYYYLPIPPLHDGGGISIRTHGLTMPMTIAFLMMV